MLSPSTRVYPIYGTGLKITTVLRFDLLNRHFGANS